MTLTTELTPRQIEERDALLAMVGTSWEEVVACHEMRCGGCRSGWLRVDTVEVVVTRFPASETVTVKSICDQCGVALNMPLRGREETIQP